MVAPTYNSPNYSDQNGGEQVIGGSLTFLPGASVNSPPAGVPGIILPATTLNLAGLGGAQFKDSGNISTQLGNVGTGNDTTEDTLFSFTLPANTFDIASRGLFINAFGSFANNAHNKTVKLYFGNSVVLSTGAQAGANVGWNMFLMIYKTGPNAQIAQGQPIYGTTHGGVSLPIVGSEVDTAPITIKLTGTNGTAAAGDIIGNCLNIEAFN